MRDVPGSEPGEFEWHHTCAMQRQQPAYRPREGNIGVIPAHRFIKFDPFHQPGQGVFQHLVRRVADFLYDRHQVLAAIDLTGLQISHT